jgi:hypothetical protein
LKDCKDSVTPDCQKARQDVRNAAAEYIRNNNSDPFTADLRRTYQDEKNETIGLALGTLDGKAVGAVQGIASSLVDSAAAFGKLVMNVSGSAFGDKQSQLDLREGAGATWDFVKDINNWPQLLGAMSLQDREKLATAYEKGDGKTVGQILGEQALNLPIIGAGSGVVRNISKVDKGKGPSTSAASAGDNIACTGGSACFVAGTLVQTSAGLKAIETFVGGELVYSRHEHTQEMGLRPVIATKQTHDQALFEVVIQNAQGHSETLHTTAEHPFWVINAQDGAQWMKASLLAADMQLIDHSGNTLTVQSQTALNETATVYNIQVQEHSTYHVGVLGTWVHNANCCNLVPENVATAPLLKDDLAAASKPKAKFDPNGPDGKATYSYGSLNQGQGLNASVDASGVLRVEVKSGTRPAQYGTGSEMFDDMMSVVNKDGKVTTVQGQWSNTPGLSDNFDAFTANLKAGMTPKEAALNTWTGKQAARYGFTTAEVNTLSDGSYSVNFTKGKK